MRFSGNHSLVLKTIGDLNGESSIRQEYYEAKDLRLFHIVLLGGGQSILLEARINHKLAVRGVNIPAKVGQRRLILSVKR